MNRSLDKTKLTPRVPEDHEKWSTERRQEFLQFAIDNFDWDNGVTYAWWEDEGISWLELTQDNPLGVRRTGVTGIVYNDSFESLRTRQQGPPRHSSSAAR